MPKYSLSRLLWNGSSSLRLALFCRIRFLKLMAVMSAVAHAATMLEPSMLVRSKRSGRPRPRSALVIELGSTLLTIRFTTYGTERSSIVLVGRGVVQEAHRAGECC